jgi:hypothetical protein
MGLYIGGALCREWSYYEINCWVHSSESFDIVCGEVRYYFATAEAKRVSEILMQIVLQHMDQAKHKAIAAVDFESMLAALKGAPEGTGRLDVLRSAFPFSLYTAHQVLALLKSDAFSDPFDRLECVNITCRKLLHPTELDFILSELPTEQDRENARLRLKVNK